MKLSLVLASCVVALASATEMADMGALHLRIHASNDKGGCTITNESQCNGQNWSGSTCCADPNYECRWDDYGGNVQRCQKKGGNNGNNNNGNNNNGNNNNNGGCTITNESQCDGQNWSGSRCCADSNYECRWDDYGQNVKRCQKKKWHHHHHHKEVSEEKGGCTITNESQCNGQNWSGSTCCANPNYECRWDDYGGNVQRCQKKGGNNGNNNNGNNNNNNNNNGGCTITNESQCDGQNWSGSRCCADSNYECRWDDYGQNVKRCQKKKWHHHHHHKEVSEEKGGCTITNESQCNGQNWSGSTCCADPNYECRWDDYGGNVQRCQKKGGNNGNNNNGNNNNGNNNNNGGCTITNESQCDGQNWSGSRCCADSNYECRWDDYGQNVKRCQKKKW